LPSTLRGARPRTPCWARGTGGCTASGGQPDRGLRRGPGTHLSSPPATWEWSER
jgi:hypothetical protein